MGDDGGFTTGTPVEGLAELLRRTEEATDAFIRGDMDRYLELTAHVAGFTLMNPFGGPASRYEDRSVSLRTAADYFADGEARLEVQQVHAWGDTLVLVMIERQHGRVGGLPDQEWDLRVTQVYRREEGEWMVVHRHADPLARSIDLEQAAALARG
jgi:ketosteroid isomerase-like protein